MNETISNPCVCDHGPDVHKNGKHCLIVGCVCCLYRGPAKRFTFLRHPKTFQIDNFNAVPSALPVPGGRREALMKKYGFKR